MKLGDRLHRFWQSWHEAGLPSWPWRLYCAVRGHRVADDQCLNPEHRYCVTCSTSMPGAEVTCP